MCLVAQTLKIGLVVGIYILVGRKNIMEKFSSWFEGYSLVARCLCSILKCSKSPRSFSFWKMTPMLPTMLDLSAITWSPADRTMYPPDAATSRAKVYNFKLCLLAKSWSFYPIIWLCTASPPGELTTTARAAARDVPIFLSRFTTCSVLGAGKNTFGVGLGHTRLPLESWSLSMSWQAY